MKEEEEEWKKLIDRKWVIFWKRYKEDYPVEYDLYKRTTKRIIKMFEKTSPFYGEDRPGNFQIKEDGELYGNEPFFLMFGAFGEIILGETKKINLKNMEKINKKLDEIENDLKNSQKYLKYVLPELEDLIDCPHCNEYTTPMKEICIKCGKKILKEENNE